MPGTMGTYTPGWKSESPLEFALFGLARQGILPDWAPMDTSRPILDLGPGAKLVQGAHRLDYPTHDFDADHMPHRYAATKYAVKYVGSTSLGEYADSTIGGVVACHILEHLFDPREIIDEVARVLAPNCPFNIVVPDADSTIYKQDVDHKTAFCLDTWKTLLDNGGYYDNHSPRGLRLGCNFKFAIKEGNEIIVTQLIKV